jgi:anthranilate synthase component I
VLADLETPLSVYLKLAKGPYSYLFESVQGGEKWGRYSIIGLPARTLIKVRGHQIQVERRSSWSSRPRAPTRWPGSRQYQSRFRVAEIEGLPRFTGGLVGYFGYDTIRYIEPKLAVCPNPDQLGTPDILLMVSDEVVVFDNLSGRLLYGGASGSNRWTTLRPRRARRASIELKARCAAELPQWSEATRRGRSRNHISSRASPRTGSSRP